MIFERPSQGVGQERKIFQQVCNLYVCNFADLRSSLQARGSNLLVLRGNPQDVLPRVWKDWNITRLCFEVDTEEYAKDRDIKITEAAKQAGAMTTLGILPFHSKPLMIRSMVSMCFLELELTDPHRTFCLSGIEVVTCMSHTLYDTKDVVAKNGGKPPLTYKGFEKAITSLGPPSAPVADPPANLPPIDASSKGTDSSETGVPSLSDLGYPDDASTDIKVRMSSRYPIAHLRLATLLSQASFLPQQAIWVSGGLSGMQSVCVKYNGLQSMTRSFVC